MGRFYTVVGLAAGALLAGTVSASAAAFGPIVNGDVTYAGNQLLKQDGNPVDAGRSDPSAVFDNDANTFFSLGLGGHITADVSPLLLASGSVVEVTFSTVNLNFPESVNVLLNGTLLGSLSNQAASTDVNTPGVGSITRTQQSGQTTSWLISVFGPYSSITLLDTTANTSSTPSLNDGFDIATFKVSAVPLPASVLLLLAGLGGLGFFGRSRKVA